MRATRVKCLIFLCGKKILTFPEVIFLAQLSGLICIIAIGGGVPDRTQLHTPSGPPLPSGPHSHLAPNPVWSSPHLAPVPVCSTQPPSNPCSHLVTPWALHLASTPVWPHFPGPLSGPHSCLSLLLVPNLASTSIWSPPPHVHFHLTLCRLKLPHMLPSK